MGIPENNLPIPNANEWELKCQRRQAGALTTLFHMEPSPRALKFVPAILLCKYGWAHGEAGAKYDRGEMSFRQTINAASRTDRGFGICVNRKDERVEVSFDAQSVASHHKEWLKSVEQRAGLGELVPKPYWGFRDLFCKAGDKLLNCFYIQADCQRREGVEYFRYSDITMLEKFSLEKFVETIERGNILIDFDARSGHNHGTKFRLRGGSFHLLYDKVTII